MQNVASWMSDRWMGAGLATASIVSLFIAGKLAETGGLSSPFAHLGACLSGQYQEGVYLIAGHCPACWAALGFAVLALAAPVRKR